MYTPNNAFVYCAAYAGAIAAMTASDRLPPDIAISQYAGIVQVAGAYAQEFDTLWGSSATDQLELDCIEESSTMVWLNRSPLPVTQESVVPGAYLDLCAGIIIIVESMDIYVRGQGITPPPIAEGGPDFSAQVPTAWVAVAAGGTGTGVNGTASAFEYDTTGAQCTHQLPPGPTNGQVSVLKGVGASNTAGVLIVPGAGGAIEDPGNQGNVLAANATAVTHDQGVCITYRYQAVGARWLIQARA